MTLNREANSHTGVVVISGAGGGGIGSAILRQMILQGREVFSIERTEAARLALLDSFPELLNNIVVGDVGEESTSDELAELIERQGKKCHVVIHNAARGRKLTDVESVTSEELEADMRDIVYGAVFLAKKFSPQMKTLGSGRIILISSSAALRGSWGRGITYAAAKSALHGLSKQLALQLAEHSITSNVVVPFQTLTPRVLRGGRRTEASIKTTAALNVPLGRPAFPQDVASLVIYLASPAASYITGQDFSVDGGQQLAPRGAIPR